MTDRRFLRHQHIDSNGARMMVQCRFCRLNEEYNKFYYVAPCGCAGPTRYVHRTCLQRWATVKFQHVYNQPYQGDPLDFNVFCEMCQQRMEIEFSITNKCSSYDQLLQNLEEYKMWFVVMLLVAIISICALIFLIVWASSNKDSGTAMAVAVTACCLALIADISAFVWKFACITSIDIEKIPNNKDPPKIMGFEEPDIHEIENNNNYQDPHFGGELTKKDPYADRSLMLESRRSSNEVEKASSCASKTFTDIIMKQMYKHDLPSERDRQSKATKSIRQKPQMKEEEIQVTINEHFAGIKAEKAQAKDKSIQMSFNDNSVSQQRRSRSRKIFQNHNMEADSKAEPAIIAPTTDKETPVTPLFKKYAEKGQREKVLQPAVIKPTRDKETPQTRPSRQQIDQQEESNRSPQHSSERMESECFNIIKQKSSEGSSPLNEPPAVTPKARTNQSKLKLKNTKEPIKIKVFF